MTDKRVHYRRYEDRRQAMMLAVHEILFEDPPGPERDRKILRAIVSNYRVDRAAFVTMRRSNGESVVDISVRVGDWMSDAESITGRGKGLERLIELHEFAEGALTFESVRKPEAFAAASWSSLWEEGLGAPARALLSVSIKPVSCRRRYLMWLQQTQSSREWSSRDRDLSEEIAALLKRAEEKGV